MSGLEVDAVAVLYKDPSVIIEESGIIIPRYYFPKGTPKRIPWCRLQSVRLERITLWNGKCQIWGMNLDGNWLNWDARRPLKKNSIVLNTGNRVKPVITPADPETAMAAIESRLLSSNSF